MNVFSLVKPYTKLMIVAWSLMLIELAVELSSPLIMAKIIDDGVMEQDLSAVSTWGMILLVLSLVSFAAGIVNSFFAARVSQNYGFDVRKNVYEKIQRLPFFSLNQFPTSSFITRLTNDVTQIQNTLFMSLRIALRTPLLIIFGTVMALLINVKLALIYVFAIPLLVILLIWVMKKGISLFRSVQQRLDRVNRVMRENLIGIKLIKAFYNRNHEQSRFRNVNQELKGSTLKALRFIELIAPTLLFLMNICIVLVLWFGNFELNNGGIQAGEVVAIVNYGTRITHALGMLTWIIMAFSRAKASADRVNEVLLMEDERDTAKLQSNHSNIEGDIEFDNVSFSYFENHANALEDISFRIKPGETVALIGATGSGKTSLFQLIPRLFEPTKGNIYIDGKNSKDYTGSQLRRQIGYVPQEAHLFTGSVKENISWGKRDATEEEIIQAAKDAQIHDSILQFPNGYDTVIGQRGVNLSGGQKQRLSIARALVRKPKILLLDDSTSALDLKTEQKLLQAIANYQCTMLVITQKISTAKQSDLILLLDEGRLIAKGTHEELLQTSALYKKIAASQQKEEVVENVFSSK